MERVKTVCFADTRIIMILITRKKKNNLQEICIVSSSTR